MTDKQKTNVFVAVLYLVGVVGNQVGGDDGLFFPIALGFLMLILK
jgi:hypothetical protein